MVSSLRTRKRLPHRMPVGQENGKIIQFEHLIGFCFKNRTAVFAVDKVQNSNDAKSCRQFHLRIGQQFGHRLMSFPNLMDMV